MRRRRAASNGPARPSRRASSSVSMGTFMRAKQARSQMRRPGAAKSKSSNPTATRSRYTRFSRHTSLWQITRAAGSSAAASGSAISSLQVASAGATYRALTSCRRRSSAAAVASAMSVSAHAGYGGNATSPAMNSSRSRPSASTPTGEAGRLEARGPQEPQEVVDRRRVGVRRPQHVVAVADHGAGVADSALQHLDVGHVVGGYGRWRRRSAPLLGQRRFRGWSRDVRSLPRR